MVATAVAEEPPANVDTVVVPGERVAPTAIYAPTTFGETIDAAVYAENAKTVTDALSESVGIQVRRFGGLGAFSTVSIRGSSAKQVQIYLDGVPVSRANNETVNVADLPIDSLDRIELYRGQSPIRFGAGAIGGVVNLVTRDPTPEGSARLKVLYGSFDTWKGVASVDRQWGRLRGSAHVAFLSTEGDFAFSERSTAPGTPPTLVETKRRNNEVDSLTAILKSGLTVADGIDVDITSEWLVKDQGVPGIGRSQSRTASLEELRSLNYLRVSGSDWFSSSLEGEAKVFGVLEREEFRNRRGDLFGVNQDVQSDSVAVGASVYGILRGFDWHQPSGFVELSHEGFESKDHVRPTDDAPKQKRLRLIASLQEQMEFLAGAALLVPTLRFEHLRDTFGPIDDELGREVRERDSKSRELWSPSIGAQLDVTDELALLGNIGIYRRAPNLDELFGNRGFVQGNSNLRPEKGLNRDVGLRLRTDSIPHVDEASIEYAYFNNDVDDLIVLVQLGQQFFRPENIGGARIRGHELSLHARALDVVALDVNYTRQEARNRGDVPSQRGRRLPGRPRDEVYMRWSIELGDVSAYYELNYIGSNFLDRVNFREVERRELHGAGVGYVVGDHLRIALDARNLTDSAAEDVAGFPLPGRSFFGSVELSR